MTDIRIIVTPPVPNNRQRRVIETRVERSIDPDSLGWTEIRTIPIEEDPQEIVLQQVDPGTHYFRSITFDDAGAESPGENVTPAEIGFDDPSDAVLLVAVI